MHKQGVLATIARPADLKALAPRDRVVGAGEIRERICTAVSKNGGHFGSNLGVVELSIALHTVFDSPRDRIVWDVSHQCYAHKLLTGRQGVFDTLRQYDGMSGFCHKGESDHDTAFAGHAGTATSIALGLAQGAELGARDGHTISVVGDASVVTGMTFEALNHAGWLGTRMTVILNDNGMSIAPPIGGLHRTLTADRHAAPEQIVHGAARGFFESIGLRYVGPIAGHDTERLIAALEEVRDLEGPTLLHIHTNKGEGWSAAVKDPVTWHAAKGFLEPRARQSAPKPRTWTQAFAAALVDLARKDERVVAVTAAMPGGTGLDVFTEAYPDRCFDVGICEQHGLGFASGLELAGKRPVVAIYSTFLQRAYDQLLHDVAIQGNPVVFAMDRGGLVGDDGVTHQGLFDVSFLRCIPDVVLLAPQDEEELRAMLRWASGSGRIVGIRWPRDSVPARLGDEHPPIELGRGHVVRGGRGAVAFVAYGAMVEHSIAAADLLEAEGIPASVVNPRFAKPIDVELLVETVEAHERVVTVEDHAVAGGFGSACLEALALARPDLLCRVALAGVADSWVHHGARPLQLRDARLDAAGLADRAREALAGSVLEARTLGSIAR